jgi:capsular exopolysaccharide synthesis family protein
VPNALSDAYIQLNLEARLNTTEQAKEWLSKQLEDLKAKVERADEALQEFGSKYGIITIDDKENITIKRLSELNEALAKAESERMAKEAIYKQIKQDKYRTFDVLPSVLENKLIQELKQTYIQLEAQYMKLAETFKPNYPEMVRLKSQMEAIQRRLNMEVDKIVAGIKSEYESGLRRESLLRAAFEQQKVKTMEMQQKSIQYNILKREADTNKELYKNLLLRMKEVGISATIHASNIQIVDKAEVPTAPYKPNAQRTLFNAAMVALFLGVGLAFFFEYLDNTVKAPEDVERLTQLPSLGIVPEISHEKQRRLERGAVYPVELATFGYPKSALSEAYRSIRTSILLSSPEKPPKRVAITSPNPLEGKTTTVINTAIALSQAGAKVLIIDTDMRKPRVHKVFDGKKNEMGLSSFLSGNVEFEYIIKKSEIPNLYYIPAGPIPPNPSELISSSLFKRMIESLENRFDHIVFDSPPVLGFADSVILSTYVDGIILVVMCGKTPKETLQMAKDVLYQVNAKILGVVINRVDIRRMEYDYYYRYHYYYGKEGKKREIPHILNKRSMRT